MGEPATIPSREGELLGGKYRLGKRLGVGGMAEVYRAENERIGRPVAIKVLLPDWADDPGIVERFRREARAANRVRHTNVVDVLDIGEDENNLPYMVQELLHGKDLAAWLTEFHWKLSVEAALGVMIPVVEAVAFAHSQGVVHRDLKPENVFLADANGVVVPKVLDFGISKITSGGGGHRLTSTGTMMGTPAYMSPEQCEGASAIDARTDVWALGVMLYEMLAGAPPFEADSRVMLFMKISREDPAPLRALRPDVPESLAGLVAGCLRRDVKERYADGREVLAALRSVRDNTIERIGNAPTLMTVDLFRTTDRDDSPPFSEAATSMFVPPESRYGVPVSPDTPKTSEIRPTGRSTKRTRRTVGIVAAALLCGAMLAVGIMELLAPATLDRAGTHVAPRTVVPSPPPASNPITVVMTRPTATPALPPPSVAPPTVVRPAPIVIPPTVVTAPATVATPGTPQGVVDTPAASGHGRARRHHEREEPSVSTPDPPRIAAPAPAVQRSAPPSLAPSALPRPHIPYE